MRASARDSAQRIKVLGLKTRFALTLTAALAAVMALTGFILFSASTKIVQSAEEDALSSAVKFTHDPPPLMTEPQGWSAANGVQVFPFRFTQDSASSDGRLYRHDKKSTTGQLERLDLLAPTTEHEGGAMLRAIAGIFAAVLGVGALVSVWVAGSVSRPVGRLIDDVRQIAKGDLRHRTRVEGPGEIQVLARAIDRMAADLAEGQESKLELSVRERELELATGVRDALMPTGTPLIEGYDLGASFLSSPRFGGDFHDFVVRSDGLTGLLVCDVSGHGVPAALVGSTARAYLRVELERPNEVADAFARINRWLARDMRRGMFVTALYALLDPRAGRATVACAGHKIPLLRLCAADGQLRVVQPEGIALGFDKGPVFERRLQVVEVPIDPGDRLVLANSAPVRITDAEGQELGEKAFYARVKRHGAPDTTQFLRALRRDLEQHAGKNGFQEDISLVTVSRNQV
jgi:sigma-B regulation protein RsbU (phosphoserine phosphatase)